MRNLALAAALFASTAFASTPALAVTANSGTVAAGTTVTVGAGTDTNSNSDSGAGAPASLAAAAASAVVDNFNQSTTSAFVSTSAAWASAAQGSASMSWGWTTLNAGSPNATQLNTNGSIPNWSYDFTTGSGASSFNVKWTLNTSSELGSTFGIQNVYGSGGLPFFVTPSNTAPGNDTGSFSVALNPNTTYVFGFYNYGNLGTSVGFDSQAAATFNFDWNITDNGIPEPTSWAMLIAGFGLVGAGMRQRRRQTA